MVLILISCILISSIAGANLASSTRFVLGPACRLGMTLFTRTGKDCVPMGVQVTPAGSRAREFAEIASLRTLKASSTRG